MKKFLSLVVISIILLIGTACSKEEFPKKGSIGDIVRDDQFIITVDGKEESIKAKTLSDINDDVKEIKVPVNADVTVKENGDLFVENGGYYYTFSVKLASTTPIELPIKMFKGSMPYTEYDNVVPVNELDLSKYPELKGYDVFLKADGTDEKNYLLVNEEYGKNGHLLLEATIRIDTSAHTERNMKVIINSIASIELK